MHAAPPGWWSSHLSAEKREGWNNADGAAIAVVVAAAAVVCDAAADTGWTGLQKERKKKNMIKFQSSNTIRSFGMVGRGTRF